MRKHNKGRARITHMAMLNWRGIAAQIIEMDRMFNALEGPNGAGKTTFMSVFYVALMPDLSLMKIVNVGDEEAARESGLHGKLGTQGASYAVLDLVNPDGERCLAGVQLLAKTAPHVDIHRCFFIRNLPAHVPMEDVLILRQGGAEQIPPDVHDIKQIAALHGAQTEIFLNVNEYGATLFKNGILPVDLGDLRARGKFNRILQTSFQGNFSKGLQARIKEYLLSEDPKIGGAVEQMQTNIQNNRMTRQMLERTKSFHEIVREVFHGALNLMEPAIATVKLREAAKTKEHEKVYSEQRRFQEVAQESSTKKTSIEKGIADANGRLATCREEAGQAEETARRAREALDLSIKIDKLEKDLEVATGRLKAAQKSQKEIHGAYTEIEREIRDLDQEYNAINDRVADASKAWSDISRQAGLYLEAQNSLSTAKETLAGKKILVDTDSAQILLEEAKAKEKASQDLFANLRGRLETAEGRVEQFRADLDNLAQLAGRPIAAAEAFGEALRLEKEFEQTESFLQRSEAFEEQLLQARQKANDQQQMRLDLGREPQTALCTTSRELATVYRRLKDEREEIILDLEGRRGRLAHDKSSLENVNKDLLAAEKKVADWERMDNFRQRLQKERKTALDTREQTLGLEGDVLRKRDGAVGELATLKQRIEEIDGKIARLVECDVTPDKGLEALERALGGRLIASQYEEIDVDEAAQQQARLGPLVDAIIVPDIETSLEKIATLKNLPPEVWLLEKGALKPELIRGRPLGGMVAVQVDNAWRVTQVPEFPRLGYKARKLHSDHLRRERGELGTKITAVKGEKDSLERVLADVRLLLAGFSVLEASNPRDEIEALTGKLQEFAAQVKRDEEEINKRELAKSDLGRILGGIEPHLSHSYLLEAEDFAETASELQFQINKAKGLQAVQARRTPLMEKLRESLGRLQQVPPSKVEMEGLRRTFKQAEEDSRFWGMARTHLERFVERIPHLLFEASYQTLLEQEDPTEGLKKQRAEVERLRVEKKTEGEKIRGKRDSVDQEVATAKSGVASLEMQLKTSRDQLEMTGVPGTELFAQEAEATLVRKRAEIEKVRGEISALEDKLSSVRVDLETNIRREHELSDRCKDVLEELTPLRKAWGQIKEAVQADPHLKSVFLLKEEMVDKFGNEEIAAGRAAEAWGALSKVAQKEPPTHQYSPRDGTVEEADERSALLALLDSREHLWIKGREQEVFSTYLDVWKSSLAYVVSILPSDVANTDDPILAMAKMSETIRQLTETISQQEDIFRVDSTNVANAIRGRVSNARREVNRINSILEGTSFGNIADIKIEFQPIESMTRLLDAMCDKTQYDLFASKDMPLEEAMKVIYKQISGGRAMGEELFDYRNYIRLAVKILRKGALKHEVATGNNLSTGEAIGTGASILTVVIKSWEDHSSFLRGGLSSSLRFLFIDEATRLDPGSIQTLKDFCSKMEVQLLVAGPKFDAVEMGDGITYRLARQNIEGGEFVLVRGRQGFGLTDQERREYGWAQQSAAVSSASR